MSAVQIDTGSKRLRESSAGVAREKRGGGACLFEPVQVVCLESREAHVVAAGAAVAGRAGRAGNAYFVWGLSNPVTPAREKPDSSVTIMLQNVPDQLIELATHRSVC